jgi:methyltransferase (TIGR00027 family)
MGRSTTKRSTTALGILAMASVITSEPNPAMRIEDPIARRLLRWGDGGMAAARLTRLHPLIRRGVERFIPGIYGYSVARLHHMDAIVRQEAAAGVPSLVILGAGYDTRAYRMLKELSGVEVFEVDHPATSRDKRRRLAKTLDSIPANVNFVEVDFTRHDLIERLAAGGHERSSPTLFLLSGVSMYLDEESMHRLLDQVATHARRSSLAFDYIDRNALAEPDRYFGQEWMHRARKAGEEPQWGIPAGEAESVLAPRGLRLASDFGAEELTARYLRRTDGSPATRPIDFAAIAHAFVDA